MTTNTRNRRNVYPGPCTACGERVAAYQGTLSRVDGKWATTHDRCPAAVEAEREAERVSSQARFEAALTELAALDLTPVQLVELRMLRAATHGNWFIDSKLAIVRSSSSLAEADRRIGESCSGMTMDYMSDFSKESSAASLAHELARALFEGGDA